MDMDRVDAQVVARGDVDGLVEPSSSTPNFVGRSPLYARRSW